MTRALVTGAGGFAGRHLVAHLRGLGHTVVAAGHGCEESVDFRLEDDVVRLFREARPDTVYHLAGTSDPAEFARDAASAHQNVVSPAVNVLEAVAWHAKGARLVLVTGCQVYGRPARLPLDEACPVAPADLFGSARGAVEYLARTYLAIGVDYVIARPFHHTGPGDRWIGGWAERARRGETRIATGDLALRRDLSDVRDVVAGYALLAERGVPGEAYNLCGGRAVALADVFSRVAPGAEAVQTPGKDVPALLGSPAKAEALGWRRAFSLDDTLASL